MDRPRQAKRFACSSCTCSAKLRITRALPKCSSPPAAKCSIISCALIRAASVSTNCWVVIIR